MKPAAAAKQVSIGRQLAILLGFLGGVLYLAVFGGSLLVDALQDPSALRNDVALRLIEQSVRRGDDGGLVVARRPELDALTARSPSFWYVVSDGRRLFEHNGSHRPDLPIDVRIDRHWIAANFSVGDTRAALRTIQPVGVEGRLVVATSGADPDIWQIVATHVRKNSSAIIVEASTLALMIALGVVLAVGRITTSIKRTAGKAASISADNPRSALSGAEVPAELRPLTQALDSALHRIADTMDQQRRFIGNAAHELRTPLAVLRVKVEAVPDQTTRVALTAEIHRLSSLVAAMLDLARFRHGSDLGQHDHVDIVDVARATLADLAGAIIDNGIEASFETEAERVLVTGSEAALRSALVNLVSNVLGHARHATTLSVRVGRDAAIEIADNGVGLAGDQMGRVLEPFHRLNPASGGTGLGLTIVREIVAAHGGELSLRETPGGGLTIRIALQAA